MTAQAATGLADEHQWLEAVEDDKALAWVEAQNERSLKQITAHGDYDTFVKDSLAILDSDQRIPAVTRRGRYLYNFWQDETHIKGLYRRTTLDEYRKDDPRWETVLDIDALAEQDGVNWVFKGIECLYPDYRHCLVALSVGGADAVVVKEFDMAELAFVEGGFALPEAKSAVTWLDADHVLVGTDFGDDSLTTSGYPRAVKRWRRGTRLEDADVVFTGQRKSVATSAVTLRDGDTVHHFVSEALTFYTSDVYAYRDGDLTKLPIPADADVAGLYEGELLIELKSDWLGFAQGAIVHAPLDDVVAGATDFSLFVAPDERSAILDLNVTRPGILVTWLDNVKSRLVRYTRDGEAWQAESVALDPNGTLGVSNADPDRDDFFVSYASYLVPTTLYRVDAQLATERLKALPAMFEAGGLVTEQHMATSRDGTRIPYFVVMPGGAERNGQHPTLLSAYGGFEISNVPAYSALTGKNWLERGGVYAVANIRGGGEFGPKWHQAALKKNRHKAFEDFEAVAEDLIARGITSPRRLGIQGGSNGGLLVGAAFTRRPALFRAVVCQVPLLDMRRYNKLLAGASWMGEYGNPDDPDMWEYIATYSPYHNVTEDAHYPKVFFTTSTRDDRVHPGHARKMVAKMTKLGHDVLYFENTEGGHAGAADNRQRARVYALIYAYLWERLGPGA